MTKPIMNPYKMKENEIPKPIAIQGLIYCKSGSKTFPVKRSNNENNLFGKKPQRARISTIFVSACLDDDKGYFLAKLLFPLTKYLKNAELETEECKAFLEKSSLKGSKVPLDINGGIKDVHIISSLSSRLLKNANLYPIKPFFYINNEQSKRISNNKG